MTLTEVLGGGHDHLVRGVGPAIGSPVGAGEGSVVGVFVHVGIGRGGGRTEDGRRLERRRRGADDRIRAGSERLVGLGGLLSLGGPGLGGRLPARGGLWLRCGGGLWAALRR